MAKKDGKGKKKKGGKGKKEDWGEAIAESDLQAYQQTSATPAEQGEDGGKARKERRRTQEGDDRSRRSTLFHVDKKRKAEFEKKMKKKIRFSDVLRENGDDGRSSAIGAMQKKAEVRAKERFPSSRSPFERLKAMLREAVEEEDDANSSGEDGGGEGDDYEQEKEVEDEGAYDTEGSEEEYEYVGGDEAMVDINSDEYGDDDVDKAGSRSLGGDEVEDFEAVDDLEDDAAEEEDGETSAESAFFFKSESSAEERLVLAQTTLATFEDFELLGAVDAGVRSSVRSVTRLGDCPGLNRLWRSRKNSKVGTELGRQLLPYLCSYTDALIEGRSHLNDEAFLHAVLTHVTLHLVSSRARQLRHNKKLKQRSTEERQRIAEATAHVDSKKKKEKIKASLLQPIELHEAMQDQGFCRPRVLVLCPFRHSAKTCIEMMAELLGANTNISNKSKLVDEFGTLDGSDDEEDAARDRLPEDWRALFRDNMDDDFKLGLQVNPGQGKGSGADKGVYLRLFSDFYSSDLIVASPLGLRLAVEQRKGEMNFDFLSSLEVVVLHQADVMYMQNWEHVQFILKHCNKLPEADHETDFSRVRPYFLEGRAAKHRQLIVTSSFSDPALNALFREHASSISGRLRLKKQPSDGCIAQVGSKIQQVFQLVPCASFGDSEDARFEYFTSNILSRLLRLNQGRTLIVTPSYFSYVKVRNELIRREANAAYVSEYSRDSEISRGRSRFFHGKNDVLLYSGRAHFFRRFKIRGALHLVFYSLPEYAHFYPEIVNAVGDVGAGVDNSVTSCTVLFTRFEQMALERIVGKKRCEHIMSSEKTTFMFC